MNTPNRPPAPNGTPLYNGRPMRLAQRAAIDKLIASGGTIIVSGREQVALYNSISKMGYCQRRAMGTSLDPVNVYYIP